MAGYSAVATAKAMQHEYGHQLAGAPQEYAAPDGGIRESDGQLFCESPQIVPSQWKLSWKGTLPSCLPLPTASQIGILRPDRDASRSSAKIVTQVGGKSSYHQQPMVTVQRMSENPSSPPDSRPLRVLHVVSGDLWAGAEVQVFQVVRALRDLPGIEPRVAVMNPGTLAERLTAEGIEVDVLDEGTHGFMALASQLTRVAASWRPDIVHTHRRKEHLLGAIAALRVHARTVATIHGRSEFTYPWWKLRAHFLRSVERMVLRTVHRALIAVSDEVAAALPGPRSRIIVIPNGIDVEDARGSVADADEPVPLQPGTRTIGFVGRFVQVKQVDRIVDALEILRRDTAVRWRLLLIGDGPLRETIEHHIRQKCLDPVVELTGFLSNPLPEVEKLDVLVFASMHEGLPMTALEALALGVPIVAPPLGGLTELVRESGHGVIAPSAEPSDLADAVVSAIDRFGPREGRRPSRLPARYTVGSAAHELLALYRGL